MTTAPQPKPIPIPALLVYGKPTSSDHPQASWFPAEDRPTVVAAAESLKFSVLNIQTEGEKALTAGVHEGVLKGNSRMIVGSVTPEVYKRIEDYVAKASLAPAAVSATEEAARAKPLSEQNKNEGSVGTAMSSPVKAATTAPTPADGKPVIARGAAAPSPGKPEKPATATNPWETLRVGSRVLAAYWGEEREFEGFWLATVKRVENGEFTLEWVEGAGIPAVQSPAKKHRRSASPVPALRQIATGPDSTLQSSIGAAFEPPLFIARALHGPASANPSPRN